MTGKKQLKEEKVYFCSQLEGTVHHSGEGTAAGVRGSHIHQVRKQRRLDSNHFLLFIQPETPALGMVLQRLG